MKVLLDTHAWLWMILAPKRLGPRARRICEGSGNDLFLSAASSWEISIKHSLGRLPLPSPPEEFVPSRLVRDRILSLPVEHRHALRVSALPHHHRDPFDRLLVAQSQVESLPILTADPLFGGYEVTVLPADR